MQIKIDNTTLADDANNRAVGAWGGPRIEQGGWEQAVQVSRTIQAANASLYARGNLLGTLEFSATWQADTTAHANEKAIPWQKAGGCPRGGALAIDSISWGDAVVERLFVRVRGVEVTANYTIKYKLPT